MKHTSIQNRRPHAASAGGILPAGVPNAGGKS